MMITCGNHQGNDDDDDEKEPDFIPKGVSRRTLRGEK
jgi:hypothetical protein